MFEQMVEFGLEGGVGLRCAIFAFEVEDQRHQRFGHIAAAEGAEMASLVGAGAEAVGKVGHRPAALRKAAILSTSLTLGALSTPVETSTSGAPVAAIAAATVDGSSPPAMPHTIAWRRFNRKEAG